MIKTMFLLFLIVLPVSSHAQELSEMRASGEAEQLVEIRSDPNGAIIYLDEIPEGTTNAQLFRSPGKYKLWLTKPGYLDVEKEIEVKEGAANKFVSPLVKNISSLMLNINPPGAEIEIDGKSYAKAGEIELVPGSHLVVVRKAGYIEAKETIAIELRQTITKTITLEPVTGSLRVKVAPIEAEVNLLKDGQVIEKWEGSKIIRKLLVGSYSLEAQSSGYERSSKYIEIKKGKTTTEEIALKNMDKAGSSSLVCGSQITYEGKIYKIVQTGGRCWLKENLDAGTMIDGKQDAVNNGRIEKYCYGNDSGNCAKYGGLYQWKEAMAYSTTSGTKGICPDGWHIPTKAELKILTIVSAENSNALKAKGQGTERGEGTDTRRFSALLAGYRDSNGRFGDISFYTDYWSSTEYDVAYAYAIGLNYNDSNIYWNYYDKVVSFSIRCIEDN
ncbi:MAG: FISUMP domain-containing protein [Ignavibacteria bacterium]